MSYFAFKSKKIVQILKKFAQSCNLTTSAFRSSVTHYKGVATLTVPGYALHST